MTMDRIRNERLLLKNQGIITNAAKRTLPSEWELADWISELNLIVWKKLPTYDSARGAITTWIMAVAYRHSSIKRRRRKCLKRNRPIEYRPTGIVESFQPTISSRLDIEASTSSMDNMLRLYVQSVIDGVKLREFADIHGMSLRQVRYLKTKVREVLGRKLKAYEVA